MSAIAGILYRDGRTIDRTDVERMVNILAHRGPDGSGTWHSASVGLGHRMLWSTPESLHERLPLASLDNQYAITADARIDNREELISLLQRKDRPSNEISDSELILAAYEKWGDKCPEKLTGDFAFVIWDGRNQSLFCARDHFGVKPFYYFLSDKLFCFASEIKALHCLAEVPRRLNEVNVARFLLGNFGDSTTTYFDSILRLSPRHTMTVSSQGMRSQEYWSLDPSFELKLASNDEYAEAFREHFGRAVKCRMRSAFPVGSMLSGGLDSSSITCMARMQLGSNGGSKLHTFSAIFDKVTQCDERQFINPVVAQNGLEPHYFHADEVGPLTDLDRVLWHEDELLVSGNRFLNWGLYRQAKELGVRVILDGFDGDTTVSHGTGYLMELARAHKWVKLIKESYGYARHFENCPPGKLVWRNIERHGLSPRIRQSIRYSRRIKRALTRRLLRRQVNYSDRKPHKLINQDFIRRIQLEPSPRLMNAARTEREIHYGRLSWPLMSSTLEALNRAAEAFQIDLRFPFWDKRLAEFCLALPPDQKLNKGWNRMVMRRAMNNILPSEVQWRGGKMNLTANFEHGLLTFERERLEGALLTNSSVIADYVDTKAVKEAYERLVGKNSTEENTLDVWKAASLALWLQHTGLKP